MRLTKPHILLAGVVIVLAAMAVRVYNLDTVDLRGDEAYSVVHWTATPFSERWQTLWRDEPAPVGAFTMYWAWVGVVGESEFAVRYLSVLGNVFGLAVIIALARRLLRDDRLALLAGVVWAVHPFLIWHAQDARVYGVLSALTPLTFLLLIRALDSPDAKRLQTWTPYIAVQTAALYLYYLEPFWLLVQGLYVLWRGDHLKAAIQAWVIVGILAIPVVAQLYTLMFVSQYQGTAQAADFTALFSWFVPTLLFGENTLPVWIGALIAFVLLGGLVLNLRRQPSARLLVLWIVVPVILLYGASFVSSFFRPRYVMTVIPALVIALVALPAWTFTRRKIGMATLLVLVVVGVSVIEVRDYFVNDPLKAPDWVGLMDDITERTTADDTVMFGFPDPAIEYYFSSPASLYIVPLEWSQSAGDQAELERLLDANHAVFVVDGGRTAEIVQYLRDNAQTIPGGTYTTVLHYRDWTVKPDEIMTPLDITFGDVATLRGYTMLAESTLMLYWQAQAQTNGDYSVLLHLEASPDAPPAAVLDHAIAGAVISTQTWTAGDLYRDPIAIPTDLAPGDYTIRVGFKDANGDPLPHPDCPGGRCVIGQLEIG